MWNFILYFKYFIIHTKYVYVYIHTHKDSSVSLESPGYKNELRKTVTGQGSAGGLRTLLGDRPPTEHHGAGAQQGLAAEMGSLHKRANCGHQVTAVPALPHQSFQ